jgi:hypothetical protein
VLFRSGNLKEAEEASRQALAKHTPEPMFLYHAGMIALAGGDSEGGAAFLKQALHLNPKFAYPQAMDAAGLVKQDAGVVAGKDAPGVIAGKDASSVLLK